MNKKQINLNIAIWSFVIVILLVFFIVGMIGIFEWYYARVYIYWPDYCNSTSSAYATSYYYPRSWSDYVFVDTGTLGIYIVYIFIGVFGMICASLKLAVYADMKKSLKANNNIYEKENVDNSDLEIIAEKITYLQEMLDDELITEEEFVAMKADLITKIK